MIMNRQSYSEHIINVHPNKNPRDLKVYGEKTFAETMALLQGATVTRGRLRGPGGSGMAGGDGMAPYQGLLIHLPFKSPGSPSCYNPNGYINKS